MPTAIGGALLCFALRILAMWFNWHLPSAQSRRPLDRLRRVSTTPKIALVAGATGLVGGYPGQRAARCAGLHARVRADAPAARPGASEARQPHRDLRAHGASSSRASSRTTRSAAIGTTIAEAGSQEAFREADVDAVLLFARAARAARRHALRRGVVGGRGFELEEVLSAHQGRDGRGGLRPRLRLRRHPAAQPVVRAAQGDAAARDHRPHLRAARSIRCSPARARPTARFRRETVARGHAGRGARAARRGVYRYTYGDIRKLAEMRAAQPIPAPGGQKEARLRTVHAATVTRRAFAPRRIP